MEPVKQSLKALAIDGRFSASKQKRLTKECLLPIGQHVDSCLADLDDPDTIRQLRK